MKERNLSLFIYLMNTNYIQNLYEMRSQYCLAYRMLQNNRRQKVRRNREKNTSYYTIRQKPDNDSSMSPNAPSMYTLMA